MKKTGWATGVAGRAAGVVSVRAAERGMNQMKEGLR